MLGFVHDRYAGGRPRDLVALGFYWGFVSVLGYPVAVDIRAAWTVTHAVVPLAIPAAAGAALIYRWGREAYEGGDDVGLGLAVVVLLLVGGHLAGTAVTTAYANPQGEDNVLVQYAQPEGDLREAVTLAGLAARDHETGVDVVWYGDHFFVEDESQTFRLPVADGEWYNRLPLPWYLEMHGATVNSTDSATELGDRLAEDPPPVVITRAPEAPEIADRMGAYREFRGEGRQPVGGSSSLVFVIYVHEDYAGTTGVEPGTVV